MKLPIFFEIQFRLLPQDGNLTLFHHLTKEPKKEWGGKNMTVVDSLVSVLLMEYIFSEKLYIMSEQCPKLRTLPV